MHAFTVTSSATHSALTRVRSFEPVIASGDYKAGSQPFDIPFPRRRKRLVKIVDVKNDASLRSSKSSEIHQMTITASLHSDSGRRRDGQIGRHNRSGATIKSERTLHHSPISDWDEVWNAVVAGLNQQFDRIPAISRRLPCRMRSPRTFVPQSLARSLPVFTGEQQLLRRSYTLHVFISWALAA